MKIAVLLLLLAAPSFAQFRLTQRPPTIPCTQAQKTAGRIAFQSVKQYRPAFKDAKVYCASEGELILSVRLRYIRNPQKPVDLMKEKIAVALAGKGISRVIIEGRYRHTDRNTKPQYVVTPIRVTTVSAGNVTTSTVTGGRVVERRQWREAAAIAVIDF